MTTAYVQPQPQSLFWLWWPVASFAGFLLGVTLKTLVEIVADATGNSAVLEAIPFPLFGTFLGAMLGFSTGLFQWLVLRRRLENIGAWAFATGLAWTVFWTLHNAGAFGWAHTPWGLVGQGFGHGAIVGGMIGLAQFLVLRSHLAGAARWILVSTVSWSVAGAIMHLLLDVLFTSANIHGPFDILIATVLSALFSGFALERLLPASRAAGSKLGNNA